MLQLKLLQTIKVIILSVLFAAQNHAKQFWEHSVHLNEDYLLQWAVKDPDIFFEVQVKTNGYVGFGLSRDGTTIFGADIFIAWIDGGHIFFFVSRNSLECCYVDLAITPPAIHQGKCINEMPLITEKIIRNLAQGISENNNRRQSESKAFFKSRQACEVSFLQKML